MVGGHPLGVSPKVKAVGVGPEDGLDTADAEMWRWLVHYRNEQGLERGGLPGELGIRER